ncbi:MAG: glycerate kinase, partial [Nitriliruptorales bacterium]|nr:glycerate kinase [Nitriliruptorales bacterium]
DAARRAGATTVLVGLGGSATVDGGAGALTALGYRLRVADGSGLKIGGGELHRLDRIEATWVGDWSGVEVELLADVRTRLLDAPRRFGPQKGATPDMVRRLEAGLEVFADVVERDIGVSLRDVEGSGAAGGLGFGLAAGLNGTIVDGARRIAELLGLPALLEDADVLVVGEGELDATSGDGKVVGTLVDLARHHDVGVVAVVGNLAEDLPGIDQVEQAGWGDGNARRAVVEAARRLATTMG